MNPRPHHQPRQHRRQPCPSAAPVLVGWNASVVRLDEPIRVTEGDEERDAGLLLIFTSNDDDSDAAAFVVTERTMTKLLEAANLALYTMLANP